MCKSSAFAQEASATTALAPGMTCMRLPCMYHYYRNVAAVVGVLYLLKVFLRELWTLGGGFCAFFLAPWGISRTNLRKYGEWAGQLLTCSCKHPISCTFLLPHISVYMPLFPGFQSLSYLACSSRDNIFLLAASEIMLAVKMWE